MASLKRYARRKDYMDEGEGDAGEQGQTDVSSNSASGQWHDTQLTLLRKIASEKCLPTTDIGCAAYS